jgi:tetratricopeptide (TPR) repeat protein
VRAVLDGSIRRSGNRLRVTAELVDGQDGSRLWADRYDRELRDVFAVQDEVARSIVEALRVPLKVGATTRLRGGRPPTSDPEAHDLYLQGRFLWNQRTSESLKSAASYFQAAIKRDSGYAEAYAGLADTYVVLPQYGGLLPRDGIAKATSAAEHALSLDSTLAEAYASLATARMYAYDWRGAEAAFERGLALNPSYATAHQWYSFYLAAVDRPDQALTEIQRARDLDPLSRIISANVGGQLAMLGHYVEGVRQLHALLKLDPNFGAGYAWLCSAYLLKRELRKAVVTCDSAATLSGGRFSLGHLAAAYGGLGDRARALQVLHQLEARARLEYVPPWHLAIAFLGLGTPDSTFAWLDSAYSARDPNLLVGISGDLWKPIQPDPRFARLRARLGLPPRAAP